LKDTHNKTHYFSMNLFCLMLQLSKLWLKHC